MLAIDYPRIIFWRLRGTIRSHVISWFSPKFNHISIILDKTILDCNTKEGLGYYNLDNTLKLNLGVPKVILDLPRSNFNQTFQLEPSVLSYTDLILGKNLEQAKTILEFFLGFPLGKLGLYMVPFNCLTLAKYVLRLQNIRVPSNLKTPDQLYDYLISIGGKPSVLQSSCA